MKVIFLDIDGVLNCRDFFNSNHEKIKEFYRQNEYNKENTALLVKRQLMDIDYNKLLLLKKIIDETHAQIVITSSWKQLSFFSELLQKLDELGFHIDGWTLDNVVDRGAGIKKYLNEHQIEDYVILDDDIFKDYDQEMMNKLVKTSFNDGGLLEKHTNEIIKRLKK